MDDLIDVTASSARAQELCIDTRAASCGRPGLETAIAHARRRAQALGVRQTVHVQRGLGRYFRISNAGSVS